LVSFSKNRLTNIVAQICIKSLQNGPLLFIQTGYRLKALAKKAKKAKNL
jgi:hypothetical protein